MSSPRRFWWVFTAVLLVVCVVSPWRALSKNGGNSAIAPTTLRTEYRSAPLGIGLQHPRLSWRLTASERGARQTAYRIQVAASEAALADGENLLWDTGKVMSDRSIHHRYEGSALASGERYFWRVRVWDRDGQPSSWSEPAWWEMGLLEPSDWQAEWIEPGWNQDASQPQPSPMLREEFDVEEPVASARLYVTAHGLYEMHLNGQRVGDRLFTPGWTSYGERLQVQTYDVSDLVREGPNAIGAVLGDGWFRGYLGFEGDRNNYGENVALLAQLRVTYEDGSTDVVVRTQDGWTAATGPIRRSDIYMGETYDARREMPGWAQVGHDEADWHDVRVVEHNMDVLIAPTAPPVRRIQEIKPVDVLHTPEGDTVLDMGQNMVGWMRMRVEGDAGTTVTLRHAEVLDKEGNFYTANLRDAEATDRYVLNGEGEEVYEPRFTFHGFRYVDVSGYPGKVDPADFTGVVIHSDLSPTGHVETSHPLINQLQHNIVWGQKGNFLDVPTDCPQRDERLGWTGDIQVFARTAIINMNMAPFLTKWLRDLAADQRDDGSVPHVIPNVLGPNASGAAGWADAAVIVPWAVYQAYGDARVLEEQYASMKAWVDYVRRRARMDSTTYLWDNDFTFGDWLAFSTDRPDYPGATTDKDLISTAYFAHSAHLLAQVARTLGREEDARTYGQLYERVKQAFQEEFVTRRGRVTSDTQTSYVLALSFDLFPEAMREGAARRLVADVRSRNHLTTGFLGTPDLLYELSTHGHWDAAYDLLLRTEYPSWLYPVTRDATTIWERWDGIKPDSTFQDPGMNSFNHYAYGAVGQWIYEEVAGIEVTAPGYKKIRIAPRPDSSLTHARAFHRSMYGRIESSWRVRDGQFRLSVTVPPNTQATVRLPHADRAAVTESGSPLTEVRGVAHVEQVEGAVVVEVGAGTYAFVYEADALRFPEADANSEARSSFSTSTKLAELLADAETRNVLMEQVPSLMNSPWLSQAMGVPLERAPNVVPVEISSATMQAVDRDLRAIER